MITDWIAQTPTLGLAVLVIFGPGLLIGTGLRLRGLMLWAAAPGISVGVLSILAILFSLAGLRWGHLSVGIAIAAIAVVVWLLARAVPPTRWSRPRREMNPRRVVLLGVGLLVGGGLNAARLMTYIGLPTAISQTNDAVFHLNALRWIDLNGSASSLDLPGLIGEGDFYPAAWHAVASLVAFDNASIPLAANMVALVIAAAVWPLGISFFTRVVTGSHVLVPALAAALSAGLLAFPQLMFQWGVLYPYALSVALVPATAAITMAGVAGWLALTGAERFRVALGHAVASIIGVVAIALSQPSSLLLLGLLLLLWMTGRCVWRGRSLGWRMRVGAIVALTAAWAAFVGVWLVLAYLPGPVLWRSYRGVLGATFDVVMNAHSLLPAAVGMSMLMTIGLFAAVRSPRLRWLVAAWAAASILYVVSVATDLPIVKRFLTGPWYGDSFRLAAIVPVFVIPLAALGLSAVIVWGAHVLAPGRELRRRWTLGAIAVTAAVGVAGVMVAPVVPLRVADETDPDSRYSINSRSYLSTDEYALLRRLPELTPADALLIANPSTGAAFAFVLGERDIIPRTWSPPQSEAWSLLAIEMREAAENPAVCQALEAYGSPDYVLDFGPGDTRPGQYLMPGMTGFSNRDGFDEVAREGDATLWRITACD